MNEDMKTVHLHMVSDSTGETVQSVARACIVQFEGVTVVEHMWSLVRTPGHIDKTLSEISRNPGIVLFTVVNEDVRRRLLEGCQRIRMPCVSVLDPFMNTFANYLGLPAHAQPGRQHSLDSDYFSRIDAMQFALGHDDGQGLWDIDHADVILTGVSRTSKTPTCMYLANRGIKAANVPFVPGVGLPEEILRIRGETVTGPLVSGLTKDPASLVQIRRNRLRMIAEDDDTDYVDLETVRSEVQACRRVCTDHGWQVIDVSRRSIEETAAAIMQHLERRHHDGLPA